MVTEAEKMSAKPLEHRSHVPGKSITEAMGCSISTETTAQTRIMTISMMAPKTMAFSDEYRPPISMYSSGTDIKSRTAFLGLSTIGVVSTAVSPKP